MRVYLFSTLLFLCCLNFNAHLADSLASHYRKFVVPHEEQPLDRDIRHPELMSSNGATKKTIDMRSSFESLSNLQQKDIDIVTDLVKKAADEAKETCKDKMCIPGKTREESMYACLGFVIVYWVLTIFAIVSMFLCCRTNIKQVS